jgi:hypothetical protein
MQVSSFKKGGVGLCLNENARWKCKLVKKGERKQAVSSEVGEMQTRAVVKQMY